MYFFVIFSVSRDVEKTLIKISVRDL